MPRVAGAEGVAEAAAILERGGLVVFPTETVYGLGANALDDDAVRAIFAAKGRPADNPVIVHIANIAQARRLAARWPEAAQKLAQAFWPGPLSLVVQRAPQVPDSVTGGLDTVALRIPRQPMALQLLEASGLPIAAPSANASGRPSPTRVEHALADLGDRVPLYLDGGPCDVGLESTVVDVTGTPRILRQGGISRGEIEAVVGPLGEVPRSDRPLAPGMKYRHYAPRVPLFVVAVVDDAVLRRFRGASSKPVFVVPSENSLRAPDVVAMAPSTKPEAWAHDLFAVLRRLELEHDAIIVQAIPEKGLGAAVMERLGKAARG